jgi:hypothetical protein
LVAAVIPHEEVLTVGLDSAIKGKNRCQGLALAPVPANTAKTERIFDG